MTRLQSSASDCGSISSSARLADSLALEIMAKVSDRAMAAGEKRIINSPDVGGVRHGYHSFRKSARSKIRRMWSCVRGQQRPMRHRRDFAGNYRRIHLHANLDVVSETPPLCPLPSFRDRASIQHRPNDRQARPFLQPMSQQLLPALRRTRFRRAELRRQRVSGLRRHVPLPEQGASISTKIARLARSTSIDNFLARIEQLAFRYRTLPLPAHLRGASAWSSRLRLVSLAISFALAFCIAAASASVLPPAPAQRSSTVIPAVGTAQASTISWLPKS